MSRKPLEPLTFAQSVAAGSSGTLEHEVRRDGRIEHVSARIYVGAENDLHLNIMLEDRKTGVRDNIITPIGKTYIDGDDDFYNWTCAYPIRKGDKIVIKYNNTDATYSHSFRVNVEVDYDIAVEGSLGVDL